MSKKTKRNKSSKATLEAAPAKQKQSGKGMWKLLDHGATIASALVARKLTATTWRVATGKTPPVNAKHPDVSNREAVAWAVIAGALIELTKVLIRRGAATYWVKSTGNLPPGVKPLKTPAGQAANEARLAAVLGNEKPADSRNESTGKTSKRQRRKRTQ